MHDYLIHIFLCRLLTYQGTVYLYYKTPTSYTHSNPQSCKPYDTTLALSAWRKQAPRIASSSWRPWDTFALLLVHPLQEQQR